ncbi:GMC family oxidoreductase [Gammaproteobacteria bacterium]|nr:GMC family oxidoreductase [Gammaproteobacteria bacterium]
MHKGLSASVYAPSKNNRYFFESMYADPRFVAIVHPGAGDEILKSVQDYRKIGGFGILLVDEITPSNKIYIDKDTGSLEVFYRLSRKDKNIMQYAMKRAVDILFLQGAKAVMIPTGEHITSEKGALLYSKKTAYKVIDKMHFKDGLNYISSAHMQSSNKMGQNPSHAVVSHNFRFPTSISANPMQSIYTVAKIFSDKLVQDTTGELLQSDDTVLLPK